jgi:ribosomal protein L11 methyltransferase
MIMPVSSITHRSAKSWLKIRVLVDGRMTEAVAAYLASLTGGGLEIISSGNAGAETTQRFSTETVTAYIPIGFEKSGPETAAKKISALQHFLERVHRIFPDCPAPVLHTETIMEEDWGEKWKHFFTSFHVTPTLVIKPSWEVDAGQDHGKKLDEAVIEMDPGLAFGTGHHASTQLALLLLEEIFSEKGQQITKVLDVGTGSGILAMACRLFGASEILALDNDPDAVETARQNIRRNHLGDRISVTDLDLSAVKPGFDLAVANITLNILADLAPSMASLIKPRGFLVLSGILRGDQEHAIAETYGREGLVFIKSRFKDEWAALLLHKK